MKFSQYIIKVHHNEGWQHKPVVQLRAPTSQACFTWRVIRSFPEPRNERTNQQLLHQTHLSVGWHFKASQLEQAKPSGWAIRRIQLIDTELRAMRITSNIDQDIT